MRRSIALLFSLLATLGTLAVPPSKAQRDVPTVVELQLSGPRLIRRGDRLQFKAVLVNLSAKPVAFALRQGGWDCDGVFTWTITDTGDHLLPPVPREPVRGMICCLTSGISEEEMIVLRPGEKLEVRDLQLGDPSNLFAFPGKGFYKVTLQFLFRPGIVNQEDGRSLEEVLKSGSKLDLAFKTGAVGATSNVWNVYLAD